MHYMPTGKRGRQVGTECARGIPTPRTSRGYVDARSAELAEREVRKYAARRGIPCAPQRKRVKRKSAKRDPEREHGPCRTVYSAEPVAPRRGKTTVMNWREGRYRLTPEW